MTTQEFIEFASREIEKRKWFADAKAYAEDLLLVQKDREKAERARDEAIKRRDEAMAEIDAARAKATRDANRDRQALEDLLGGMRRDAEKQVQDAQAALVQVRGQVEWHRGELQKAKDELEAFKFKALDEQRTLTERSTLLKTTVADLEERVAAVLKK